MPQANPETPLVSVLLPARDAERFLGEALDSLRAQTLREIEILALDDGSRDGSHAVALRHARDDPRLRLLPGPPRGLAATLNRGLAAARAPLVARMDADDVALPERLARQIEAMRARPDLAALGTGFVTVDEEGREIGGYVPGTDPDELREGLMLGNRLAHPTVMLRRDAVLGIGGYREAFTATEDYDLWLRLSEGHALSNLPDKLLRYRAHGGQVTARAGARMALEEVAARLSARARRAGRRDPLDGIAEITPRLLLRLGAPREAVRAALSGVSDPAIEQPRRGVRAALADLLLALRERDAMGGPDWPRRAAEAAKPGNRGRIFVMMPSYRDAEAQWTIRDLFEKAAEPGRVSVGVVWQVDPRDDAHCFLHATRPDQVRALCFDHREARGCSWARNQGMRLWDGEHWLLQVDSHMRFAPGWDRMLLDEIASCPSAKPLLTNRPPHYGLPDALEPAMFNVMSADRFAECGTLIFSAVPREAPAAPAPTPFCGGGFLFGAAARAVEVPFDPHVYFLGEEPNLAVRLWTAGWDFFAPRGCAVWHHYGAGGPGRPHSWNEVKRSQRLHARTLRRMEHLLGVRRCLDPRALVDLWRYGLGRARSLGAYERYAGVSFRARRIEEFAARAEFAAHPAITG